MNSAITTPWQLILALAVGVIFFIVFSAGYGLFVYTRPTKFISTVTPADLGLEFESLILTTSDGLELAAWYIPAQKETKKSVMLLHGYPADKGDILGSMTFLQEEYNLLFLDFRYFGESEGSYSTIGIKEVEDILSAVEFLKERGNQKVGVWGFSAGAASALMALPKTNEIDAVVSESSYASLNSMAKEAYQIPVLNQSITWLTKVLAKLFLKIDIERESPLNAVKLTTKPILFIHSSDDEVIPYSEAQALRSASENNPNAEYWFRDDLGHGYIGTTEYNERVISFFGKVFK